MPSISSLKAISEVFNVSIDELLSSEEIIEAAEKEKKENMKSFKNIIFGIIDLMSIIFLFIPLFGKEINGYIFSKSFFYKSSREIYLFDNNRSDNIIRGI